MRPSFDRQLADQVDSKADPSHDIEMVAWLSRNQNFTHFDVERYSRVPNGFVHQFLGWRVADGQRADPCEHRLESGDL